MASQFSKCLWIILIIAVIVICLLDEVDSRRGRGGFGSGSRRTYGRKTKRSYGTTNHGSNWGKPRSRSVSRGVNLQTVVLAGFILGGSSGFSHRTWRRERIYNKEWYMANRDVNGTMPTICTNKYKRDSWGRKIGHFICPGEYEDSGYKYCCGPRNSEYCCNVTQAKEYYWRHHMKKDSEGGGTMGILLGVLIPCLIGLGCVFMCRKMRQGNQGAVITKGGHPDPVVHHQQMEPLHDPNVPTAQPMGQPMTIMGQAPPPQAPPPAYQAHPPPPHPMDDKPGLPGPQVDPAGAGGFVVPPPVDSAMAAPYPPGPQYPPEAMGGGGYPPQPQDPGYPPVAGGYPPPQGPPPPGYPEAPPYPGGPPPAPYPAGPGMAPYPPTA